MRHLRHRLGAVALNRDQHPPGLQKFHDGLQPRDDIPRIFETLAVVARDIRLALRRVDQDRVDLVAVFRRELDVGRKTGAAQTDKAAPAHSADKFLKRVRLRRRKRRVGTLFAVAVDLHGPADGAVWHQQRADCRHRAGDGGVDRRGDKLIAVADDLSDRDRVARGDGRDAGRADVLIHREDQMRRGGHVHRFRSRRIAALGQIDAAPSAAHAVFKPFLDCHVRDDLLGRENRSIQINQYSIFLPELQEKPRTGAAFPDVLWDMPDRCTQFNVNMRIFPLAVHDKM